MKGYCLGAGKEKCNKCELQYERYTFGPNEKINFVIPLGERVKGRFGGTRKEYDVDNCKFYKESEIVYETESYKINKIIEGMKSGKGVI